ncbi:TetR family transcriptional regulator [Noviherbaspirillum saxi]|uniref:TetR family transcriptional regulator n=1 Tax=Noviherbaspirillum saxi TaxID=2320863 RepID=A0A3A3FS02_9BURK|nr:TetR family transcriptional regulator [Noviherbaspirillum saxi]RJF98553.1 TetR family transcriptional regulator [Noviherbaspirillum saxi]
MQHLSERAGVAVSSIYEYFPTMEALIAAIFDDFLHEARSELAKKLMRYHHQSACTTASV